MTIRRLLIIMNLLAAMFFTPSAHSKPKTSFPIPGNELWGTWKVVSYDTRDVKVMPKDRDAQANQDYAHFPIGQIISFKYVSDPRAAPGSIEKGFPAGGEMVTMHLQGPLNSQQWCQNESWSTYLNCPAPTPAGVEMDAYVMPKIVMSTAYDRKLWKEVKRIGYEIIPEARWPLDFFTIWIVSKNRLIIPMHLQGGEALSPPYLDFFDIGVVLERVSP